MRFASVRDLVAKLRLVALLVPWRMRPKLILLVLGSIAAAGLDLAAVVLVLPVMQLVSGTQIDQSPILSTLSRWTGLTEVSGLLLATLVTVVVLMVVKNVATLLFRWWSLGIMANAQADATHAVMSLYMNEPWLHHRRRPTEEIFQTLNIQVGAVFTGVMSSLVVLITDLVTTVALLVGLLVLSPLATLVAAVFFGGAALLTQRVLRPKQLELGQRMQDENLHSWRYLSPAIDGFKEVRVIGASQGFADDFARARRAVTMYGRVTAVLSELPRYLLEIVMVVGILVIALVLFATVGPANTFPFLGVFAVAAVRLVPTLNRMLATTGAITTNLPNLDTFVANVTELRRESEPQSAAPDAVPFPLADIEFAALGFSYPDSTAPVLTDVSGTIAAGSTVALVGGSGAGKTTFVELLLTLFTPVTGSITVGGRSIHDDPVTWRSQVGMVAQDVYLRDCSIAENIAFGVKPNEIDQDRLARAIRMAELDDLIATMPNGVDTLVGHMGARVSGGQKQRIGIARALYRQPQVLVLDEATSALDNETEHRITRTIDDLHGTMTIVIVAHRLSTVKNADQILFFSGGRIAARGTMAELVEANPEFAELVRLGRLQ